MVHNKQTGMTLLEIIISLGILSVLMLGIGTVMRSSLANKDKSQERLDRQFKVRAALEVMAKDITRAFHFQDYHRALRDSLRKQWSATPSPSTVNPTNQAGPPPASGAPGSPPNANPAQPIGQQPLPEWLNPDLETQPQRNLSTHFFGEEEQLHFITMNNPQVTPNSKEADYIEVGYFLDACSTGQGRCLYRRTDPLMSLDIKDGGMKTSLLANVLELKFRYLGKNRQDYSTRWESTNLSDGGTANLFPELVEVQLTVEFPVKGKDKKVKVSEKRTVPIQFPNNEPFLDPNAVSAEDPQNPNSATSSRTPEVTF